MAQKIPSGKRISGSCRIIEGGGNDVNYPVDLTAGDKKWSYLGHAHIFERNDGEVLTLYDDGDIDCTNPYVVSDAELRDCQRFVKENGLE